jgi:transposase
MISGILLGKASNLYPRRCSMILYTGFDLHSSNMYLGIIDKRGKRIFKKKLLNDSEIVLKTLKPYRSDIIGIVVESTYNWYWLVDLLMANGYRVHLANPAKIQRYSGLKYADDQHDAFWLAEMLRLSILPEGYIYPKEERPIRDLLRKRGHLVRLRTSLIISLQNIISRNNGFKLKVGDVKALKTDRVAPFLTDNEDLALAGRVSKESIDFLTRQIRAIESVILKKVELREPYQTLLTIPGIGKVLALTIMLETGTVTRFAKAGNYVSYCRKVSSQWVSNDKTKGKGNRKSGNKYLAWAFSEAAEIARRYYPEARAFYNKKMQKTNIPVAHNALSHKLAKAAFYMMRDGIPFMPEKCFA